MKWLCWLLFSRIIMTSNHLEFDIYKVYSIRTIEIELYIYIYIGKLFSLSLSFLIIEGIFNSFTFFIYIYIYLYHHVLMSERERQSRPIIRIPEKSKQRKRDSEWYHHSLIESRKAVLWSLFTVTLHTNVVYIGRKRVY